MKIEKLSNNFTPRHESICFEIDSESEVPADLTVEIIEATSGEVVATQLLRNTTTATVNIAPYIARIGDLAPSTHQRVSFIEAPTAAYKIRIGEVESEEVVVSVNRSEIGSSPAIISTMPTLRRIARGENDSVLIKTNTGEPIYAEIESDNGETLQFTFIPQSELSVLVLSLEDFHYEVSSFDVWLYYNGSVIGTMHYKVVVPPKTATRLAWLSDKGSVEQYTFPKSVKTALTADKRWVLTAEGVSTAHCRATQKITLASRIEPRATIEALAEVATSTKVWVEQNGSWRLVEVATSEMNYNLFGEPSNLLFEVCLRQKEVAL